MRSKSLVAVFVWLVGALSMGAAESTDALREQVRQAETAFAKTMADRDHAAFVSFLSDEAIFMGRTPLRGKAAVAEAWKGFYEGKAAPFSWQPEVVEVLDSGKLALSTGPVYAPSGERTGTFTSTWRREKHGQWKIVLDSGCPPCNCGAPEKAPTPQPSPSPR